MTGRLRLFIKHIDIIERMRNTMTDAPTTMPISPSVKPTLGAGPLGNVEDDIDEMEVVRAEFVAGTIGL